MYLGSYDKIYMNIKVTMLFYFCLWSYIHYLLVNIQLILLLFDVYYWYLTSEKKMIQDQQWLSLLRIIHIWGQILLKTKGMIKNHPTQGLEDIRTLSLKEDDFTNL